MTPTLPTRLLMGKKPHKYVPASHTDVRATIAKFRRLQQMQAQQEKT